jgi:F-type H+-transporting ATPase subunit gamma
MLTLRDVRRRVRSVGAAAQITRAMQMVAASKMRRAQEAALAGRPFARLLYQVQRELTRLAPGEDLDHPLLARRPVRARGVVLVAADKGLCGALNSNVFRLAAEYDPATTVFVAVGRRAAQFVARSGARLADAFSYGDRPRHAEARAIAARARELFLGGEVDEVQVVATRFVNTLSHEAVRLEFLPVGEITAMEVPGAPRAGEAPEAESLFEPDGGSVLEFLLSHYLDFFVYQVLLNAKASEHSARMVAMKNATDNAERLISDLTLEGNKRRQGNITQELLEIAGGQED